MKKLFGPFLLLIVFAGCRHKQKIQETKLDWHQIVIWSEATTRINLFNDNDLSNAYVFHTGSFFAPLPKGTKVKVDTIDLRFTTAETDSIFNIVNELISSPPHATMNCTDFVGELKLIIDYGYFRRQVEYSGICNWNTLSDRTMLLHNLLKRKLKNVYLGENKVN